MEAVDRRNSHNQYPTLLSSGGDEWAVRKWSLANKQSPTHPPFQEIKLSNYISTTRSHGATDVVPNTTSKFVGKENTVMDNLQVSNTAVESIFLPNYIPECHPGEKLSGGTDAVLGWSVIITWRQVSTGWLRRDINTNKCSPSHTFWGGSRVQAQTKAARLEWK